MTTERVEHFVHVGYPHTRPCGACHTREPRERCPECGETVAVMCTGRLRRHGSGRSCAGSRTYVRAERPDGYRNVPSVSTVGQAPAGDPA